MSDQIKFAVACVILDGNMLIDFEMMPCVQMIGTEKMFVNMSLMIFGDSKNVGNNRCVQWHGAIKDQSLVLRMIIVGCCCDDLRRFDHVSLLQSSGPWDAGRFVHWD